MDAEKLMQKKRVFREELDKLTPRSAELWTQASARLEAIQNRYGKLHGSPPVLFFHYKRGGEKRQTRLTAGGKG